MIARVFVLLARKARVGVVIRRGPSRQVLLLRWDTQSDIFEMGQWLKGRIYERRCDLSPSGERFIYFAAKFRGPIYSWTAVSRPPYLTALALWPKRDTWGGGGLFGKEYEILLNHAPQDMTLAEEFRLPKRVTIDRIALSAGRGEDEPISHRRLRRDGWNLVQKGTWHGSTVSPPEIWSKDHPHPELPWLLRMIMHGVGKASGPWYIVDYELVNREAGVALALGRIDWADWCASGDLLFSKKGKIFRTPVAKRSIDPRDNARELVDLNGLTFEPRESPAEARQWTGPTPKGVRL